MAGAAATVMGAAPHVLHHVGPLAGAAVLAGSTGRLVFGALAFLMTIPLLRRIHGHTGSWTAPALAGLVGVFALQSAKGADRRLVLAGYRPLEILGPRLVILTTLTALVVVVSLAVTALSFTPRHWPQFIAGNVLIGLTYAMLGAIAGSAFGALGATYVILFGAMLDLGIAGNPMFGSGSPPAWTVALPGGGAMRVITDASFAGGFAAWSALAVATIWLLAIAALLSVRLSRQVAVATA